MLAKQVRRKKLKPLEPFNAALIQPRLKGLFQNVDEDLLRRIRDAEQRGDEVAHRELSLLSIMLRITVNAYQAVCFLIADSVPDSARKPTFALVAAPINRQLMDLLFSLVYIRDDFGVRSLAYEKSSWRAFKEDYEKQKARFTSKETREYFADYRRKLRLLKRAVRITKAEARHPEKINLWKGPFKLAKQKTASQPFLQWMVKWLYDDTSAESHIVGTGIFKLSPFLMANLANPDTRDLIENHQMHQYRTHHVARTFMVALAIATEMDDHCRMNYHTDIAYIWTILGSYISEAKEMYDERYKAMLDARNPKP